MTEATRLTKLPGYDTAPDVYETPEITSEPTSTAQPLDTSTSGSSGSDTETANSDEDGPFGGISRKRLFPERARSRFQAVGNRLDTRGLDLSDRVDGRRRGLHVRQRRAGHDVEDETLEARIARLRKEVEECRTLARDTATDGTAHASDIDALGRSLALLDEEKPKASSKADQSSANGHIETKAEETDEAADQQTLSKIAAFDGRLSALERALGISSMDMDASGTFTTPVLPSLQLMDSQLSALMTATSIAQLDASSSRIKKLSQEADQLAQLQATPRAQANGEDESSEAVFSQDDMKKLESLYGLLPTLQGLSPTVPALLERLRSLTALHSGAAIAANELDELVKKQADMAADLTSWKDGLDRLEEVVKHALEANGRNGNTVDAWVKDLQKRVEALR